MIKKKRDPLKTLKKRNKQLVDDAKYESEEHERLISRIQAQSADLLRFQSTIDALVNSSSAVVQLRNEVAQLKTVIGEYTLYFSNRLKRPIR
jgi:ribosomal protein L29